jgi:hypothetical protein
MVADSVMGFDPLRGSASVSADVGLGEDSLALEEVQKILETIS